MIHWTWSNWLSCSLFRSWCSGTDWNPVDPDTKDFILVINGVVLLKEFFKQTQTLIVLLLGSGMAISPIGGGARYFLFKLHKLYGVPRGYGFWAILLLSNVWITRNRPYYSCITVVCSVTWPLEGGGDFVVIQTSMNLSCNLVSIRTSWFTPQKQWGLYQNKVTYSLTTIQRPGHWADNCKMVYWGFCLEENILSDLSIWSSPKVEGIHLEHKSQISQV